MGIKFIFPATDVGDQGFMPNYNGKHKSLDKKN